MTHRTKVIVLIKYKDKGVLEFGIEKPQGKKLEIRNTGFIYPLRLLKVFFQ